MILFRFKRSHGRYSMIEFVQPYLLSNKAVLGEEKPVSWANILKPEFADQYHFQ